MMQSCLLGTEIIFMSHFIGSIMNLDAQFAMLRSQISFCEAETGQHCRFVIGEELEKKLSLCL